MPSIPTVSAAFETQAEWCIRLGSAFTSALLRALLPELADGAPVARLIGAWPGDPLADILPLRVAGALHALVLSGADPALAALYPPHAWPGDAVARPVLRAAVERHAAHFDAFLRTAPQTNEVARSAVLLGGFLTVAAETKLPLRTLEIGASAGLNLFWDRFHYRLGDAEWGDPASPVRLAPAWDGSLPPLDAAVRVAHRAGCDIAPIDITDADQRLRLRSYIWADQADRLARLDGALELALRDPPALQAGNATDFVRQQLAESAPGLASVLYHSIMWNYVAEADRASIAEAVQAAGKRATTRAPLAWLTFELRSADSFPTLELTLWPGGETRQLATANPHGVAVAWQA